MKLGASFPVKAVSVSAEASSSFALTVEAGLESSKTKIKEYESETIKEVTTEVYHKYTAHPAGGAVKVVFKEVWKLGDTVFKVAFLNCDENESKKEGWKDEKQDVTSLVAVARQWYRLRTGNSYLNSRGYAHWTPTILAIGNRDQYSYDQQWAFDNGHLISKSGRDAFCYKPPRDQGWCYHSETGKKPNNDRLQMVGRQLRSGHYCMYVTWQGNLGWRVKAGACGAHGDKERWTIEKAVSCSWISVFSYYLFVSFLSDHPEIICLQ